MNFKPSFAFHSSDVPQKKVKFIEHSFYMEGWFFFSASVPKA